MMGPWQRLVRQFHCCLQPGERNWLALRQVHKVWIRTILIVLIGFFLWPSPSWGQGRALGLVPTAAEQSGVSEDFEAPNSVLIDVRAGDTEVRALSRKALAKALERHSDRRFPKDLELQNLLGTNPYFALLEQGRHLLAGAALAYGRLDCPSASAISGQAILDLSAALAQGARAKADLHKAHLYRFLCAHRRGESDKAKRAASMLRHLTMTIATKEASGEGQGAWRPREISEKTWRTYVPALISSSVLQEEEGRLGPIVLQSHVAGAKVWVDYQEMGVTPMRITLSPGEHLLTISQGGAAVSKRIEVEGPLVISLSPKSRGGRWAAIADHVNRLKTASRADRLVEMLPIMRTLDVEAAFVMRLAGRVEVWILPIGNHRPEFQGSASSGEAAVSLAVAALQQSRVFVGIDPMIPLLREEEEVSESHVSGNASWWVLGVVVSAAAIGAGLILFQDLGSDTQRIEVNLP